MGGQTLSVLKEIVSRAHDRRSSYVLAIDNADLGELPPDITTSVGKYTVARPLSEIMLRHVLWQAQGSPVLAVLDRPLAERLPADLVARAQGGKVFAIETSTVLSLALGGLDVIAEDEGLQHLALEHLDHLRAAIGERTLPTVVDRDLLEDLLLDVVVRLPVRTTLPGAMLARWLEAPFSPSAIELKLIERQLSRVKGPAGKILAWALVKKQLDTLLIHGVLLTLDEQELAPAVWGKLADAPAETDLTEETFRRVLRNLVAEALDALGPASVPYLSKADGIGKKVLSPATLRRSRDLPLGLEGLCEDAARRAAAGEPVSHETIRRMRQHRFAGAHAAEIDVLEEIARLSRYLTTPAVEDDTAVVARVRAYQREGAFADWAAARLRLALAGHPKRRRDAEELLDRYRARRNAENHAFAQTLSKDCKAALHAEGCVPLYKIWRSAPVRGDGAPDGRLYLVVLDGCSYPVFLRLLAELASAFDPIGLRVDAKTKEAQGAPALALLPSITSHSRSALFLGEVPNNPWIAETVWRDTEESKSDPARFRQNDALGSRTRRLFLKGDLVDQGESLIAALEDEKIDVVAVVFNAVDDQIGSANTGAVINVRSREIAGFVPSLSAALRSGRRVVLTADHGHTPFVSKDLRVAEMAKEPGSARHRGLPAAGGLVPEGFIEIDDGGMGGMPGRKAFAWKMGVYQGSPQVGFHGGCSLEELVVPLAELVQGGVGADEPRWWLDAGSATTDPPAVPPPIVTAPVPAKPKPTQANLFDEPGIAEGDLARIGLPQPLRARLDATELAALVCIFRNKNARSSEIAAYLKRAPARMSGLMSRLMHKLDEGGFPCLQARAHPGGEQLYVYVRQESEAP